MLIFCSAVVAAAVGLMAMAAGLMDVGEGLCSWVVWRVA